MRRPYTGRRELMMRSARPYVATGERNAHPEKQKPLPLAAVLSSPTGWWAGGGSTAKDAAGRDRGRRTSTTIIIIIIREGNRTGRCHKTSFIKRLLRRPTGPVQSGGKLTATPQCRQKSALVYIYVYEYNNNTIYYCVI